MYSKEKLLKELYPNGIPFSFDYAIPHTLCEQVANTVSEKTGQNSKDVYSDVCGSVYAYGKGNDRGQGFVPLTLEAFNALNSYAWITGTVPFYVPVPLTKVRKG